MMRTTSTLFAAALALAAYGCSKPSPGGADAGAAVTPPALTTAATPPTPAAPAAGAVAKNACSVASAAEASTALGMTFTDPKEQQPRPFPAVSNCEYTAATIGYTLNVRLEKTNKGGWEATKRTLSGGSDVAGVGEMAYSHVLSKSGIVVTTFMAFKDGNLVTVTFGGMGLTGDKGVAGGKALTTQILAKPL